MADLAIRNTPELHSEPIDLAFFMARRIREGSRGILRLATPVNVSPIQSKPAVESPVQSKPPVESLPSLENLRGNELSPLELKKIAEHFRLTYNNEWPDFLVCIPCDQSRPGGMRLSALQAYELLGLKPPLDKNGYVPLSAMDKIPALPDCPCCRNPMRVLNNPRIMEEKIEAKLTENDGYITLLRDPNHAIVGHIIAHVGPFIDVIPRELANPYLYIEGAPAEYDRNLGDILAELNTNLPGLNLTRDTPVLFFSSVAIDRSVRKGETFLRLMRSFFDSLPKKYQSYKIISEVIQGNEAGKLFQAGGGVEAAKLGQGHGILVTDVNKASEAAHLSMSALRNRIIAMLRPPKP